MANMSDNIVVFIGEPVAIENVKALFREIEEKQDQTGQWHLPPYVTAPFSNMMEILINNENIRYQTRWSPNFEGLIQIADHFQLDFTINYDQLTDGISGEASYKNKLFKDNRLDKLEDKHQQNGLSR